jgi:prepilin-type processing-associated H-X9-DG protein
MSASHLNRRVVRSRGGFTITELVVTIGIMAILMALLMPVVSGARAVANQTRCSSNLKQIYTAAQSFNAQNGKRAGFRIQAVGWMSATYPHMAKSMDAYKCIESDLTIALDTAGSWSSAGTVGGPAGGGSGGPPPNYADAYIQIDAGGGTLWNVPLVEGPWMIKKNATANSFELWLEDQGFKGGGDKDFKDVAIRITDNGNGTTTVEAIPLTKGKPGFKSAIMASTPEGPKVLMSDMYNSNGTPKPGTTTTVAGTPTNPFVDNDSQISQFTPGSIVPADYGFNDRCDKVFAGRDLRVLATDYLFSVVQTGSDNWGDTKWASPDGKSLSFARHRGMCNVLMSDGSVTSERPSGTVLNPFFGQNRNLLWSEVP